VKTNGTHSDSKHNTTTAATSSSPSIEFHSIHRSRNVGQSYMTSILSTLRALYQSFALVYHTHPSLILVNGPGTALPICYVALFYQILLFRDVQICYVESYCRVTSLSLTGWLLYPFVTRFIVQWPELYKKLPRNTVTLAEHIM